MAKQPDPAALDLRAESVINSGADFVSRTLYVVGAIEEATLSRFAVGLRILDEGPGDITIFLYSGGGDESVGYAIYDLLRRAKNKIVIHGYGAVQSAAAAILQAGDRRLLSFDCRFMIHNGSIDIDPTKMGVDPLGVFAREVEQKCALYHSILAERSGKSVPEIRKLCEAETYLSAREAVKQGFADAVLPRRRRK